MRSPLLVGLMFCYCCCCCAAMDVAVLTDGDRLTGTIEKLEAGKLHFKSRHGDAALKIDWALVASLSSDSDRRVILRDGSAEQRKLSELNVTQLASVETIASLPEAAEDNAATTPSWLRRGWDNSSISADFGQSYSGLSEYNQLSSNTEFSYSGTRWDATTVTHFDYYGASGSSEPTYQTYGRFVGQRYIRGDRFFVFPYLFLGRQTKEDGRGQIRQYGGGAGWTFHRHKSNQLSLYAGVIRSIASGYQNTGHGEDEGAARTDLKKDEPLFVAATAWDREFKNKVSVSLKLFYFKPMLESGRYGMATDASARIPLFGPAYFTVRAYDTPEIGQSRLFSTRNLQMSSGIGIEFK